jgi:hypothetical protein
MLRHRILYVLTTAFLGTAPHAWAAADAVTRNASDFDQSFFPVPGQRDMVRQAGTLSGGKWGVVGWAEYAVTVPESGWYELAVMGRADGVEFTVPAPAALGTAAAPFTFQGGTGANAGYEKISNVWLDAGTPRIRAEKFYWTGFPDLRALQVRRSAPLLAKTLVVRLPAGPGIYRRGECPSLEILTGARPVPTSLTIWVWKPEGGATVGTIRVKIPADAGPRVQKQALPCAQEGAFKLSYAEGEARIPRTDLRELEYEVVDPATKASPKTETRRLVDTIEVADRPPDYAGGPHRVVSGAGGRYRETGDQSWFRFQSMPPAARTVMPSPGWFAYRLANLTPQQPHVVEVDYPDDAPRTFAIALRESAPLSYPVAGGVDSGGEFSLSGRMKKHTLLFWPRAADARIVFMNARDGMRAAAARVRVYRIEAEAAPAPRDWRQTRKFVNWYEEGSNFLSMYGAPDEGRSGMRVASERWARTIADLGGSVLSPTVAVYSFALYPSRFHLSFSKQAEDDMVRRLLLAAEKHGLGVLPQLHPRADELRWPYMGQAAPQPNLLVSKDGRTQEGPPPLFNPLHPGNQDWYVGMIGELADRYADSPAFLGVDLRLMQWANPALNNFHSLDWGYDDLTVSAFARETGEPVPMGRADDGARFQARYAWLMANARERWIEWRCRKVAALYARVRDRVRQARADLIVVSSAFDAYPSAYGASWLREAGIDARMLAQIDGVVLVNALHAYGRRYDGPTTQGTRDNLLEPGVLRSLSPGRAGAFLSYARYFEATEAVVPPTELGFTGSTKQTWMSAVINPAGRHSIERYAVELAETDATWLGDGGNAYTLGQPELREFLRTYSRLPARAFDSRADAIDPVTVRESAAPEGYFFYAVNRERYPVRLTLEFEGAAQPVNLATDDPLPLQGRKAVLELKPYELAAYKSASGRIARATVEVADAHRAAVLRQIEWLGSTVAAEQARTLSRLNKAARDRLQQALDAAREALARGHLWRARTLLEHHELLRLYDVLGSYPPGLRNAMVAD